MEIGNSSDSGGSDDIKIAIKPPFIEFLQCAMNSFLFIQEIFINKLCEAVFLDVGM